MASLSPYQGVLGHRLAAHLLRRSSYRYTKPRVDALAQMTATQAVISLLVPNVPKLAQPTYGPPLDPTVAPVAWVNPPGTPSPLPTQDFLLRQYVANWWMHEALHDEGIHSKMMFFYHQNYIVSAQQLQSTNFFDYLALIRFYALGNAKRLAYKMVADNMMLFYLNNDTNTAGNPNENFAREFLELFTIGKGPETGPGDYTNYTEDDIREAARLLTGWRKSARTVANQDAETGIVAGKPNQTLHDKTAKQFSYRFDNQVIQGGQNAAGIYTELQQFVDMIFAKKETARLLARRLYRFFVCRHITPEIETDIIDPLATTIQSNNYEVLPALKQLLNSKHFYDADDSDNKDEIVGSMIKSPLELSLQAISFFGIPIPDPTTQNGIHHQRFYNGAVRTRMMNLAGMPIFFPSDVAGYPAYYQEPDYNRAWFNSSTIISRYKLPQILLTGKNTIGGSVNVEIGAKLNIVPWVRNAGIITEPREPDLLVRDMVHYLLPETPDQQRMSYFLNDILLDNLPANDWTYEWDNYLATGVETEVQIGLGKLINAIMYAPEFQLM
jgi:uncharacterized protein (DUF1800 family)